MNPLRIIFMGSPDFAVPSLEVIAESEHKIITVVSGSDKRRSRRGDAIPTPVKKRALQLDLPTLDVDNVKDPGFAEKLSELKADLFVVVAFKVLPENILEIPRKGSINLHASLLPKYRGAAPIHWAVINGEKETGCTVFFLEKEVDTGSIIDTVTTPIGPEETTGDVYDRLKEEGAKLLLSCINKIAENNVSLIKQDHSKATPAPKLYKENTRIDFSKSAEEVHNLVRGLNPFPVAWCMYDEKKMNVYHTSVSENYGLKSGELAAIDDRLIAGCGAGSVELLTVQLPGTKKLSGLEFINGFNIEKNLD